MRILYVEDDLRDADITVRVLKKIAPSFNLEHVPTIEAAIERLQRPRAQNFDLVFTDIHLPDGDGLKLLNYIREKALPVAVVVVTGMGDEDTAVAALKARADDYVVKRTGYLDRLVPTLESALNHYRADAARRAHLLRVLFAESNASAADEAKHHFAIHANHIQLEVVSTPGQALTVLKEGNASYDVVLLDFEPPELKALEVLREIRGSLRPDLPIVLICGSDDKDWAPECIKLGASSYVIKSPGYLYQLTWEIEATHSRAELVRREAALQESEERFRNLADTAPVFVWAADPDGLCNYCNRQWLEFTGRSLEQELGNGWTNGIHPDDLPNLAEAFRNAIQRREEFKGEFRAVRYDGEHRWVQSTLIPRFTATGEFIGYVGSGMDVTERIQSQASLERALAEVQTLKDRLQEENVYLQEEIRGANNFGEIIGESAALKRVLMMAEKVAPGDTTVLILGETGTGKELLAHAIHNLSPRNKQVLVKVNCAALPAPLIESELFGHAKGAYTGADTQRRGRFEIANHGTIFLDEVGELPLDLQAKLLRVLEAGEFERLGDSRTISVDVRVIAATNRDLEKDVAEGRFRSDLYYRLSIFPITIPPLRERREDVPLMIRHFVKEFNRKLGKTIDSIPHETMMTLKSYPWPGNIRELRNLIERAVIITQGSKLRLLDRLDSIRLDDQPHISDETLENETLESSQYNLIVKTLKKTHWRIEGEFGAAAALKINPSTLRTRMKKLGIRKPGGAQAFSASSGESE